MVSASLALRALVVVEHDNTSLNPASLAALAVSAQLEAQTIVLVAGYSCRSVADEVARYAGVSAVWCADHSNYAQALPASMSALVCAWAPQFTHVLAATSTWSKSWMPRVGAILGVAPFTDVVEMRGPKEWVRPIYAGNAFETLVSEDALQLCTVRAAAFSKQLPPLAKASAPIQNIDTVIAAEEVLCLHRPKTCSDRPDLLTARVVIAGGRGLPSVEYFDMLCRIASYFNAAVGASRAAVDAGLAPNGCQIGQTGKIIAPELYIAVGISGAIQHKAGITESGTIIAINNDPQAPIFKIADYGLVADLKQILPNWLERLEASVPC